MNRYYNPVKTIQGKGCASNITETLNELNLSNKKVLFITWGKEVLEMPAFSQLFNNENGFEIHTEIFQASNPTVEQLFDIYKRTKGFSPESVIAVGGGSIMDVGKSLCCLFGKEIEDEESLRKIIKNKEYGIPEIRWIGIPTTSGTGSEVTCWATIWDPSRDQKLSIENHGNYAYAALVDPELTCGMPLKLAVSSALDAMAHAVESYWARGTNCVSRALALNAVQTIRGNIEGLFEGSEKAYDDMAKGSMLAGLAFSNTKTTACHSISYPLTMHYGIPHGAAVSMLLAPVLKLNMTKISDAEKLLDALGVKDGDELEGYIVNILKKSGLPATLREWNVKYDELGRLAELGLTKGRADNNPVDITPADIQKILETIY